MGLTRHSPNTQPAEGTCCGLALPAEGTCLQSSQPMTLQNRLDFPERRIKIKYPYYKPAELNDEVGRRHCNIKNQTLTLIYLTL